MTYHGTDIPESRVSELCRQRKVRGLSLFGSVLRDDFSPSSDVDVLVSFDPAAAWTLWDLMEVKEKLEGLFGREALRNPWRKRQILSTYEVVYAA
ncbi:MAG: nucleotidyltransferase domain-containing protein [Planctomycetota bacterium]